ncbi:monocarboxylate transporter 12-like isoform X1 [Penaeus chinensis]|uniref:monocarboxylate transporter 12-like isoform X1 n=1 Tax=Penaeus chinensis TaxID=139456 RepID=UPI001FB6BFCA|nr:monocarboxylate transporter 12-like isoform X1 [Penaeus chinensis]
MTVPQHEVSPRKGDMEDEGDERQEVKTIPTPPDGGWGWVVVFASFMIHVFADGFTYTFGIYFVHLLQYYQSTAAATSWIASILVGVTLGTGPIAGILVNKFGCRLVTIAGAVLASAALFVSIYAPNVQTLYITIGLGAGLGFGLIYLPAIVCVTGYFEKRRSFATGIAVCGSGIGTFAFSPFVEYLINELSWQNSLIIIAGLMLNCVVFGALFRPLEDNTTPVPCEMDAEDPTNRDSLVLNDMPRIQFTSDNSELKKNFSDANLVLQSHTPSNIQRISSHGNINPMLQNLKNAEATRMAVSQPLLPVPEKQGFISGGLDSTHSQARKSGSLPSSHHGSGLLYRKDIFYRGSLLNIQAYKQNPSSYRASMARLPDAEETPSEVEKAKVCGCVPCSRETRDAMKSLMDWELLVDGIFILFAFSNFCTSIGFNAPYIFIVDRARHLGISDTDSSYLLAVVGISNTVSRILLGYISDQPWVNRLYLYNIALTLCGIGTCASIWFYSYASQIFYAIVFGSMSGAYVGLTSVVLVDLLGMERLTNAFGLLLMFQGIASILGPPMCGFLFDQTGSYDYSFLLAGSMIAISGLMLFFIPCIWRIQARKLAKQVNSNTAQ